MQAKRYETSQNACKRLEPCPKLKPLERFQQLRSVISSAFLRRPWIIKRCAIANTSGHGASKKHCSRLRCGSTTASR